MTILNKNPLTDIETVRGSFYNTILYMQQRRRDTEVYDQRDRVDDRRNERRRHDGGVKTDLLCDHRQGTADELGDKDGDDHRQAHYERHQEGDMIVVEHQSVKEHELQKVHDREADAAQKRDEIGRAHV